MLESALGSLQAWRRNRPVVVSNVLFLCWHACVGRRDHYASATLFRRPAEDLSCAESSRWRPRAKKHEVRCFAVTIPLDRYLVAGLLRSLSRSPSRCHTHRFPTGIILIRPYRCECSARYESPRPPYRCGRHRALPASDPKPEYTLLRLPPTPFRTLNKRQQPTHIANIYTPRIHRSGLIISSPFAHLFVAICRFGCFCGSRGFQLHR